MRETKLDFMESKREDVESVRNGDKDPMKTCGSSGGGDPFPWGNVEIFDIPKRSMYSVSAFK